MKFNAAHFVTLNLIAACTGAPTKSTDSPGNQNSAEGSATVAPLVVRTVSAPPVATTTATAILPGSGTGTIVSAGTSTSTSTATAVAVVTKDPRGQDTPTPTPAPTPFTCLAPAARALGSRGGSAGLGNAGERLYAPLLIPAGWNDAIEFSIRNIEVSDFALVNIGTLAFDYMGTSRPNPVGQVLGPYPIQPGQSPMFSVTISSNPGNNTAQQYVAVWYQIELKMKDFCPIF